MNFLKLNIHQIGRKKKDYLSLKILTVKTIVASIYLKNEPYSRYDDGQLQNFKVNKEITLDKNGIYTAEVYHIIITF